MRSGRETAGFGRYVFAGVTAAILGLIVAIVATAGWQLVFGGAWRTVWPRAALIVGALMFVTSGNALSRYTTLGSSSWGISVGRHASEDVRPERALGAVRELTPLGFALFAGGPLIVTGLWML